MYEHGRGEKSRCHEQKRSRQLSPSPDGGMSFRQTTISLSADYDVTVEESIRRKTVHLSVGPMWVESLSRIWFFGSIDVCRELRAISNQTSSPSAHERTSPDPVWPDSIAHNFGSFAASTAQLLLKAYQARWIKTVCFLNLSFGSVLKPKPKSDSKPFGKTVVQQITMPHGQKLKAAASITVDLLRKHP